MTVFTDAANFLSAISSVAVLLGVVFVVFQLRQNAKLIKLSNDQVQASIQQNKSSVAFNVVERFTDDAFTTKRKTVRDIIKKYREKNWEGFSETSDDFEVRAFGSYYDFSAYLARTGIIDIQTLEDVLGYRVTFDWDVMAPVAEYYRKSWGVNYIFANFQWLAELSNKYLQEKEKKVQPFERSSGKDP